MQGLVVAYRIDAKRCMQQEEHEHHGLFLIPACSVSETLELARCLCQLLLPMLVRTLVCALPATQDPCGVEAVQRAFPVALPEFLAEQPTEVLRALAASGRSRHCQANQHAGLEPAAEPVAPAQWANQHC